MSYLSWWRSQPSAGPSLSPGGCSQSSCRPRAGDVLIEGDVEVVVASVRVRQVADVVGQE